MKKLLILSLLLGILIVFVNLVKFSSDSQEKKMKLNPHYPKASKGYLMPDDVAGFLHKPLVKREFQWREHPTGKIESKTNNLGFKEDENTKVKKSRNTIRVLVTGDSHTDGVIYNFESFPNQLEKMYNAKNYKVNFEFINGGTGFYGPQNYLGVLKRFLHLKPDIFIVTLYTGNDFLDAIKIESVNNRLKIPERPANYFKDLLEVREKAPGLPAQFVNQIKFFKLFPQLKDTALLITKNAFFRIKQICYQNSIYLFVIILPAKMDVEAQSDIERLRAAKKILKISNEDLWLNQKLGQALSNWFSEQKIQSIDLFNNFSAYNQELYWKNDFHLNHNGHRAIAEIIYASEEFNQNVAKLKKRLY